jgi:HD-like signal output (HDOD) protein
MLGKWKNWFRGKAAAPSREQLTASPDALVAPEEVNSHYMQWLLQDLSDPGTALSVPEKLIVQVVVQQVRDYEQRGTAVPRLPSVIPMLLKQLRDPLASAREYAAVITRDPVVSTAVLKVANSVYFNPYRKPLDNFERVVNDLGVIKLRMVLSTAVMQPVLLDRHHALPRKVWNHSLACAACCQQLAEREGIDAFKAYMIGLVHDIGVVTLFNLAQLNSREYLQTPRVNRRVLQQLLSQWANPLAQWIAQDWNLPPDIVRALAAQHEPGEGSPLAELLRRSNLLCEAFAVYRDGRLDHGDVTRLAAQLHFPANIVDTLESCFGDSDDR